MAARCSFNRLVLFVLFVGSFSGVLFCQKPAATRPGSRPVAKGPTVTFKFFSSQMHPARYEIKISADGSASYQSQDDGPVLNAEVPVNPAYQPPPDIGDQEDSKELHGDIYRQSFQLAPALREKIFELAKAADYFQGDFEYRKHPIAFTGKKTLVYTANGKSTQTSYNWSDNQAIRDLTDIAMHISNTLEFGQRLAYEYRFEKLGLNQELTKMEEMASHGELAELHVLSPLLQQLANDVSIIHVARLRAARLLKLASRQEEQ